MSRKIIQDGVSHSDFDGRYSPVLSDTYVSRAILPHISKGPGNNREELAWKIAVVANEARTFRHAHHERYLRTAGRQAFFMSQTDLSTGSIVCDSLLVFASDIAEAKATTDVELFDVQADCAAELGYETQNGLWSSLAIDALAKKLPRKQVLRTNGIGTVKIFDHLDPRLGYKILPISDADKTEPVIMVRRHRPVADFAVATDDGQKKIEVVKASYFALNPDKLLDYEHDLVQQALGTRDSDLASKALHTIAGKVIVEPAIAAFRDQKHPSRKVFPAETTYFALHRQAS